MCIALQAANGLAAKIGLSSVGKMCVVSALLRNAIICLYGSQTSEYFELDPPTLEEYIQ
jgi:hypothetical protein